MAKDKDLIKAGALDEEFYELFDVKKNKLTPKEIGALAKKALDKLSKHNAKNKGVISKKAGAVLKEDNLIGFSVNFKKPSAGIVAAVQAIGALCNVKVYLKKEKGGGFFKVKGVSTDVITAQWLTEVSWPYLTKNKNDKKLAATISKLTYSDSLAKVKAKAIGEVKAKKGSVVLLEESEEAEESEDEEEEDEKPSKKGKKAKKEKPAKKKKKKSKKSKKDEDEDEDDEEEEEEDEDEEEEDDEEDEDEDEDADDEDEDEEDEEDEDEDEE